MTSAVDGRNPANQLRLVVYPIISQGVSTIPCGFLVGFLIHQQFPSFSIIFSARFKGQQMIQNNFACSEPFLLKDVFCMWAMKKGPLVVKGFFGGWNPTQLYRDYFVNHEITIPELTKQDFPWKVSGTPGFLGRGSCGFFAPIPLVSGGLASLRAGSSCRRPSRFGWALHPSRDECGVTWTTGKAMEVWMMLCMDIWQCLKNMYVYIYIYGCFQK